MNKKVLILSEAIGEGHTKAAEALMQGISHLAPSVKVQVFEAGHTLHPFITRMMVGTYLRMNSISPSLWGKMYNYKHHNPLSSWKKFLIHNLFHRKIEVLIEQEKPDLIISTHPFISSSLSRLKRRGYSFKLFTVITDFHAHGAWVHSGVDIYLVSNQEVYNQLLHMGVQKNNIKVTGLPIRNQFWIKKNKQDVRRKLMLKNIPTVLIMGGGLGLGGIQEIAHSLVKWREYIQIVICTGNNENLKRTLIRNSSFHHTHVHILGFVDRVDEWMEATDLLITKPGGLTCFEALFKNLPLYIYQPLPGHEERNCEFLVNNQLAIKVDHTRTIDKLIEQLLTSPKELKYLSDQTKDFQFKLDPLISAKFIVNHFR